MTYLHSRGVCHRDLKLANCLVDDHWRLKIGDYNLSRFVDTSTSEYSSIYTREDSDASTFNDEHSIHDATMTADVGSIRWMAPEIFGGGRTRAKYSLAADVYSFGMCIFELVARAPPWFELHSRFDISDAVAIHGRIPHIDETAQPSLAHLYIRCTQRDPILRPPFTEISDDLESQLRAVRGIDYSSTTFRQDQKEERNDVRGASSSVIEALLSTSSSSDETKR